MMRSRIKSLNVFALLFVLSFLCSQAHGVVTEVKFQQIMTLISNSQFDSSYVEIRNLYESDSTDPEYFVLSVNHYFSKGLESLVEIKPGLPKNSDEALVIEDSLGSTIGHLSETVQYQMDTIRIGINILKQGIELYPDRLDMRFGLVYILESVSEFSEMSEAIQKLFYRSEVNKGDWLWSFAQPLESNTGTEVLENAQGHIYTLFNLDTKLTDSLIVELSESLIHYFPKSVYGYSNIGGILYTNGNLVDSYSYYVRASLVDSTDMVVIQNAAKISGELGRIDRAIEYYQMIIRLGNLSDSTWAQNKIDLLQTQK